MPTTAVNADAVIRRDQRVLVARSRHAASNDDHGRRFKQLTIQNVIGAKGVQLQSRAVGPDGSADDVAAASVESEFKRWGKKDRCDVAGVLSWRAIQAECVRSACVDGEFFLRAMVIDDRLQLQTVDPQRCPVGYDVAKLKHGGFIRSGIEFNEWGRPLAYHFTTVAESEADRTYGGHALVRVEAAQVLHGFLRELPQQKRGLPWMSAALLRMHDVREFDSAALTNARVAASLTGFIEWAPDAGPEHDDDDDDPIELDVEAGTFQELPSGASANALASTFPTDAATFRKSQLRSMAASFGVSYHTLAQDLEGVNFSSARHGALDDRDNWQTLQGWIVEALVEPVFEKWLNVELLAGRLQTARATATFADRSRLALADWQPRRWTWVDPRADVTAAIKSKNNLFASPSQIIREQGRDPDAVWRGFAADIESMKRHGIPDDMIRAAVLSPVGMTNDASGDTASDSANKVAE